jgi:uncharacterized membrane protein YfcA
MVSLEPVTVIASAAVVFVADIVREMSGFGASVAALPILIYLPQYRRRSR